MENQPVISIHFDHHHPTNKHAFFIAGGGTKGIYALGILKYFFEDNPFLDINSVDIFGGTSVGSYLAIGLSLGLDKKDMLDIANMIDLNNLVDSKYYFPFTLYRFFWKGYLYDDTGRKAIISKILNKDIDRISDDLGKDLRGEDLTFSDLRTLINLKPDIYKHFLVNTLDITNNRQIFITTLNSQWDNIRIIDALMASSALPFIFEPIKLDLNGTECLMVDGGLAMNNPLDFILLENNLFKGYTSWLIKFEENKKPITSNGPYSMFNRILDYLLTYKNNLNMELIDRDYNVNIINLKLDAGTLEIYSKEEIDKIIMNIYEQFKTDKVIFE